MVFGAITFRTAPSGIPHFRIKNALALYFQHSTQICCLLTFTAHQLYISIIQLRFYTKRKQIMQHFTFSAWIIVCILHTEIFVVYMWAQADQKLDPIQSKEIMPSEPPKKFNLPVNTAVIFQEGCNKYWRGVLCFLPVRCRFREHRPHV